MTAPVPVITLDGPVSSGKGTIARRVAARLGWHLLDSGALYRVLGLLARQRGLDLQDAVALGALARQLPVQFLDGDGDTRVLLEGEDVSRTIRQEQVGELASQVAVHPPVREGLLAFQQALARPPGLVADGRDMGTVVFPQAPLKIYLTASAEERARRRHAQLREKGFDASIATLIEEIRARDDRDMHRPIAPLRAADDAITLDSTHMGIEQVVDRILEAAARRQLGAPA